MGHLLVRYEVWAEVGSSLLALVKFNIDTATYKNQENHGVIFTLRTGQRKSESCQGTEQEQTQELLIELPEL